MLQRTNATTNECYNERCYNERMLQRTNATMKSFFNKIVMLQRMRKNTIGQRSTRLRKRCRGFPLLLELQSSSLLSFLKFSYQFSSVICLFVQFIKVKYINFVLYLHSYFLFCFTYFLFKWLCWMVILL